MEKTKPIVSEALKLARFKAISDKKSTKSRKTVSTSEAPELIIITVPVKNTHLESILRENAVILNQFGLN